jgi:hypothetical protein
MLRRIEEKDTLWASDSQESLQENQLMLLDNVQFIYELALAQLELQSLGVKFAVTNGLREFRLLKAENPEEARRRLAYFKCVGRETHPLLSDYPEKPNPFGKSVPHSLDLPLQGKIPSPDDPGSSQHHQGESRRYGS